jgi:hypothetical protein
MQLATRTRAFTAAAAKPRSSRVACRAVSADSSSGSRRQALALLSFGCGAALLPTNSAWALIPDEEDEELLEKAKANRQKRLNSQKETTRCAAGVWRWERQQRNGGLRNGHRCPAGCNCRGRLLSSGAAHMTRRPSPLPLLLQHVPCVVQ